MALCKARFACEDDPIALRASRTSRRGTVYNSAKLPRKVEYEESLHCTVSNVSSIWAATSPPSMSPGAYDTVAFGINNSGEIVGYFDAFGGPPQARLSAQVQYPNR